MLYYLGGGHWNWAVYNGWSEFWADTMLFTTFQEAEQLRQSWLGPEGDNSPLASLVCVYMTDRKSFQDHVAAEERVDRCGCGGR